jgi:hypothetical protein
MSVNPLMVLQARAEARALLVRLGWLKLEDAIEPLWQDALGQGIDEEAAIAIIYKEFDGMITRQ